MIKLRLQADLNLIDLKETNNINELLQTIGYTLSERFQKCFEDQKDINGISFKDISEGQKQSKKSSKILVDTGFLSNFSWFKKISGNTITIGSSAKYATLHNYGGVIKPKIKKYLSFQIGNKRIFAKSVKIPKRQFIGLNKDILSLINKTIKEYISQNG